MEGRLEGSDEWAEGHPVLLDVEPLSSLLIVVSAAPVTHLGNKMPFALRRPPLVGMQSFKLGIVRHTELSNAVIQHPQSSR